MLPENVKPASEGQKYLLAALESPDVDVVGVFGPSGTGKSFIVLLYGINAVRAGKYTRMVLVRPIAELSTGKHLSSIELGELYYKIASDYLYDILSEYENIEEVRNLIREEKIVIADPNFLAGRTFDKTFIFLDDAQFAHPGVITELLLRMGKNSKLVVAGDPLLQVYLDGEKNTAAIARELLLGEERSIVVDLGVKDLIRPGAKRGFKLALEMRLRRRKLNDSEEKILAIAYSYAPDADIVTVVWLKDLKEKYGLEQTPDVLIIAKEDTLGRLIGKGGERINKIEEEAGLSIRATELTVDLQGIMISIHPLGWIRKHIERIELAGTNLEVFVRSEEYGAFVGQRGTYIRFLDEAFKRMLGIGIKGSPIEIRRKRKRR